MPEPPDGGPFRRSWHTARRLGRDTAAACLRYRVTGLGAEAAFFGVLSLPPLVFGLAGAIGFVADSFDVAAVRGFRDQVLALASQALTDEAVGSIIEPTLDEVLSGGRFEIISIGFVIALWSGSRALNVLVDGITIMYGLAGRRGIVRTRALSFGLYLLFLLVGVVVLPLVLVGPTLLDRLLPGGWRYLGLLYWPIVLVGTIGFLTTLFHVSVPVRTRWRADLPGAVLDPADLAGRQRPAAADPQRLRRIPQHLRAARRADRLAGLVVPGLDGDPHRSRLQRRRRRGVAGTGRHRSRGCRRSPPTPQPSGPGLSVSVHDVDLILSL